MIPMFTIRPIHRRLAAIAAACVAVVAPQAVRAQAWEPAKPIEFVVPAGTGGGADQMARFIQGVVAKHSLSKQPIVVVNKSGGAGAEQEDQIITVMLEKAAGKKMTYIPFKGGGDVAVQLVGKHIDATVNNPIEAESHWRAGKLRPLCVFDAKPMPYKNKLTATQSWADIPTCASAGIPADYVMLRGIFMAPGVKPEQVAYYEGLFEKVRTLPEWKEFMEKGAFNQTTLKGKEFFDWLGRNEQMHRVLMKEAGFIAM